MTTYGRVVDVSSAEAIKQAAAAGLGFAVLSSGQPALKKKPDCCGQCEISVYGSREGSI
jgi:DNA-binding transcriptional LysR family regulator